MERVIAGLDVGKAELQAHANGEGRRVGNVPAGFRAFQKWFSKRGVERVVIEATERYHRRIHQSLAVDGFEVVLVNPLRSRRFGDSLGEMAKTDRIDGAMLAKLGAAMPELDATKPMEGFEEELEGLLVARSCLVDTRSRVKQTADEENGSGAKRLRKVRVATDKQIADLDASIEAHIRSDTDWARRYGILLSIPGIGPVNAAMLLCWTPELGFLRSRQAASLLGVAPFDKDSGKRRGARHIRGGSRRPRNGLYMAATTAAVHNPDMKIVFDRLKAAGKKHKVVIVALMRKLGILANALCRFPPPARSAAALFRGGSARAQAGLPAVLAGGGLAALPGRVDRLAGGGVEGASGAGGGQHAVSAVSVGRGPEPGFQGAVDGGAAVG